MMIRNVHIIFFLTLILVILGACSSAPQALPTLPPPPGESGGLATAVPDQGYPSSEVLPPATATHEPGYPEQPVDLPPTVDPYPGGLVWIVRPIGIQCEEGTSPGYGDLREATSTLTAAGIAVADAEMTEMMVAASCGSPTSAHFRVQIAADDLQTALSMDWTQE
jgi:hypothetical protein